MPNQASAAPTSDIAFTPAVKAIQEQLGSRSSYARMEAQGGFRDRVDSMLGDFLAERDSFYLATANKDGRPYIQHRGGPKGFLKVLDDKTLAFADYSGNKQYISVGNLTENDQAFIFLMDYPNQTRIKIWGRAEVSNDPQLIEKLLDDGYKARPERAIVFHLEAWDVNCQQHIQRRYTAEDMAPALEPMKKELEELRQENRLLKEKLTAAA